MPVTSPPLAPSAPLLAVFFVPGGGEAEEEGEDLPAEEAAMMGFVFLPQAFAILPSRIGSDCSSESTKYYSKSAPRQSNPLHSTRLNSTQLNSLQ